jgi:hypothetical protein
MPDPIYYRRILPPPETEAQEILQSHYAAYEFYREVRYREAFEQYCQWYAETAAENQRDLAQMQRELNLFGWLNRRSDKPKLAQPDPEASNSGSDAS